MAKAAKRASYADHVTALGAVGNASIILVYGSSEYLLNHAVDVIRAKAVKDGAHVATLEATALNEGAVESLGGQVSLFEPATLSIIRRCEQARSLPKLLKVLKKREASANRLLFVYRGEGAPPPLRTELTRLGTKDVPCFDPWPNEVPQIVRTMAKEHGVALKGDALELLVEANGADLVKHRHELTKLALVFRDTQAQLGAAEIAQHLGMLREDDAFQLDRLLLQKQWAKAHALTTGLIARGEKGTALLGILAGHCRNVLKIGEALAQGVPPGQLATRVRLPPFILKNYTQSLGRVEPRRYLRALDLCRETDVLLKTSGAGEELLIGRVIDALAQPQ